jgi:uncharacterized membrane protein (DUF106 family)
MNIRQITVFNFLSRVSAPLISPSLTVTGAVTVIAVTVIAVTMIAVTIIVDKKKIERHRVRTVYHATHLRELKKLTTIHHLISKRT